MNKDKIIIAMFFDNSYAMHTGVAIASILKNAGKNDEIKIHLISNDLTQENKNKIIKLAKFNSNSEIIFNKINNNLFKETYVRSRFSNNVYHRLYLGKMFPKYDKVLYLDSDLIVKSSLQSLYDTKLGPNDYIAGVRARESVLQNKILGFNTDNIYVNAGVLLFNLKAWRIHNLFEKCIKYAKENKPYLLDQDTINIICHGKIKRLNPKWNAHVFAETRKLPEPFKGFIAALNNPYIIHFVTREKPWHPQTPWFKEIRYYFDYLKFTPWKNYVFDYLFKRYIFQFNWSLNAKTLRVFSVPVIRVFRDKWFLFGIPAFGKTEKFWTVS